MEYNIVKEAIALSQAIFGRGVSDIRMLPVSGSGRRYYRLSIDGSTVIACYSEDVDENEIFLRLTKLLSRHGISVPRIYGVREDKRLYILEDLGDKDLMSLLKTRNGRHEAMPVITHSIRQLVQFQSLDKAEWESEVGFPPLDSALIEHDLRYAQNNLFDAISISYDRGRLDAEFETLKTRLLTYPQDCWGLMYRDFQSRNIMLAPTPYFIDYQSARFGPGIYDLVSFAWQAKAGYSEDEREEIISAYCEAQRERGRDIEKTVRQELPYWAIFRIIQTLGAYGLRGLKEGKSHFIESIPPALRNLINIIEEKQLERKFAELHAVAVKLADIL